MDHAQATAHIATPLRGLAVPIDQLNLDPTNARRHNTRNMEAIKASLARWGQRFPIVVQQQGMIVRAGNGRLLAARELGWTHLAAVVVDESEVEAAAFAIADNRAGDLAEWDDAALTKLLESLPAGLVEACGYSPDEYQQLLNEHAPINVEEDNAPAPPDAATTKPGDLWILGNHRLLCGDSSLPQDVDRLLDGAVIHLANTDPLTTSKSNPAPTTPSRRG